MNKLFSHVMPDGSVAIISLREGSPAQEVRWLAKTCFELHRSELVNPLLIGEELEVWQMNVHFDDYQDPSVRVTREITGQELPDRARRHAWREGYRRGVLAIYDDRTIPDLVP